MTNQRNASHQTVLKVLNSTPLSRHLAALMRKEMVPVDPSKLALVQLMDWASDNHYSNQLQGEMEYGSVARAAANNPKGLYDNLADERMQEAQTLAQESAVLVSSVADFLG